VLARQTMSTPDKLDQLFVVVGRRGWVALVALTVLVGAALLWACLAHIPETVQGAGILLEPGGVRPLQAPYEGQVTKVLVQPGADVYENQTLGLVNLPDLQLQLQQAETRLQELLRDNEKQTGLENRRAEQEESLRKDQTAVLQKAIKEAEEILQKLENQTAVLIKAQKEKTTASRKEAAALKSQLADKVASSRRLVEQNLLPGERLLEAESRLLESSLSLANLDVRLAENDLKEVENNQAIAQHKARLADLRIQLLQVDVKGTQVKQEIAQARANRLVLRQEQEDRKRRVEGLLEKYRELRSPAKGRVTELLLQPGQVLQAGARIGTLQVGESAGPFRHFAYFPVAAGKRIKIDDEVRLTPTTVQRQRYGSIIGKVKSVSPFPLSREAAAKMLGNPELISGIVPAEGVIEVEVVLEQADTPTGYKWTSAGPPQPITAGTTTVTRVTVERRRPITYLLPALRKLWEGEEAQ
jgi:HlyD family secretion protein